MFLAAVSVCMIAFFKGEAIGENSNTLKLLCLQRHAADNGSLDAMYIANYK